MLHGEGLSLYDYNQDNLCVIESREQLTFTFKSKNERMDPYIMAFITPGKCTINSTSCRYELWTSKMTDTIPFNHLIQSKTPYLINKKRRISDAIKPLNDASSSSSLKKGKSIIEDLFTLTSPINGIDEVEVLVQQYNLKNRLNQYGSMLDLIEHDNTISKIKTVKKDDDHQEASLPVFYLNDHLLHLKLTKSSHEDEVKPTLFYTDQPLTFVNIDYDQNDIHFTPIYYNHNDIKIISSLVY